MEKIDSVLKFSNYIVKEVYFKRNENFSEQPVNISLNISSQTIINGNQMEINLITNIFEDSEKNNYPFEMKVNLSGYFEATEPEKFKANAIAILYPYIRAIVSTYTASANIQPLILPPINVNALLRNNEKNKNEKE